MKTRIWPRADRADIPKATSGGGQAIRQETGTLAAWQGEGVVPAAWSGFTVHRTAETRYDIMSRKVREWLREGPTGPVRTMTEYSYDLAGRPTCTAVRMNPAAFAYTGTPNACAANAPGSEGPDRITRTIHDAAGQRLQLRVGVGSDVEGAAATWDYNDNGQITTLIDGNGNRAELRYDGHGRQDRWTFPSTTRPTAYDDATWTSALTTAGSVNANDYEQYGYDPNGNRTTYRKRDNWPQAYGDIVYEYDALNRMTLKVVPERPGLDAVHSRNVHYGYDLRGLQLYARFDSASGEGVTSAWDGFGRPLSSSIDLGGTVRTLAYRHDRNGARTRLTYPDGAFFSMDRDVLGRTSWLTDPLGSGIAVFQYDVMGARRRPESTATARCSVRPPESKRRPGGRDGGFTPHWVARPVSAIRTRSSPLSP